MNWLVHPVRRSPFQNTYGGLDLLEDPDTKKRYLTMEDCFGPDYFGPLTEEQEAAFHVLCQVPECPGTPGGEHEDRIRAEMAAEVVDRLETPGA